MPLLMNTQAFWRDSASDPGFLHRGIDYRSAAWIKELLVVFHMLDATLHSCFRLEKNKYVG
jgi:hypothetical protein